MTGCFLSTLCSRSIRISKIPKKSHQRKPFVCFVFEDSVGLDTGSLLSIDFKPIEVPIAKLGFKEYPTEGENEKLYPDDFKSPRE